MPWKAQSGHEHLCKDRYLKRQHETHHPFQDEKLALDVRHVIVPLAEGRGGLQRLILRDSIARNASTLRSASGS
jgi:hypothetical protein